MSLLSQRYQREAMRFLGRSKQRVMTHSYSTGLSNDLGLVSEPPLPRGHTWGSGASWPQGKMNSRRRPLISGKLWSFTGTAGKPAPPPLHRGTFPVFWLWNLNLFHGGQQLFLPRLLASVNILKRKSSRNWMMMPFSENETHSNQCKRSRKNCLQIKPSH